MDSQYILILINLIGIFLFSINHYAIAEINSKIVLNTVKKTRLTAAVSCDAMPKDFFSSINNLEDRAEENINTINQQKNNANIPQASIWWAAEQFDPFDGNLVQSWLTYPQKQQINLTVNWQLWTGLDYFGRYRFVNQFGTVVRKYGYSLNIFSQKEQCLATYKYNAVSNPPKWELHLEELGEASLQVER